MSIIAKLKERASMNVITIERESGKELELIYVYDAIPLLGVSKQRVSYIVKTDRIPVYRISGVPFFKLQDVKDYAANRDLQK